MNEKDKKIIKKISLIQTKILCSLAKKKLPLKKVNKMISEALCKDKEIYSYMEECSLRKQVKIMKVAEDLRIKFFKDSVKVAKEQKLKKIIKINKEDLKDEEEIVKIDASGFFSNKEVIFKETYLEYGKKKVPYGEIKTVSYLVTKHSINGIPSGTDYQFWLNSEEESISLKLKNEEWEKIVDISRQFIEPLLIQKIIHQIFEKEEEYNIRNVTLNKAGYSRDKFFGGIDEVLWKDNIFTPGYDQGKILLYKEKNGKGKSFAQIPMSTANSVLLPKLLEVCVAYFHHYKKSKKK